MSEEQVQEEQQEVDYQAVAKELEAKVNDLAAQREAMLNKNNELLAEVKKDREAKREAEENARKAAEAKALKEGDYEQLLKSSEQHRADLEKQLNNIKSQVSQKEINSQALKIATELADGANAEILSEFIARRLKYTEDGLKVTDADGNLTVSNIQDLASEFSTNGKYASLLRGNQSTGGGAAGSGSRAPNKNTVTSEQFAAMSNAEKSQFALNKGKIED